MAGIVAVSKSSDDIESDVAMAAGNYARLRKEAQQARVVLDRLRHDVTRAQMHLDSVLSQLVEANGRMGLSTLRARMDADAAANKLKEAAQPLLAEVERDRERLNDAAEANTKLVLAALSAQELTSAAEEARDRLTELMAMVAHELRNPMTPIRTAAAMLDRVRPEELPRLQGIIEKQVSHILVLVDDLVDVSRISTGKLRVDKRVVDMAGVIAEAIDACQPSMAARAQQFDIDLPRQRFEVTGDAPRLVQIVSNLLDNASKYTPWGGAISLSVNLSEDRMRLTVADNGIGITADALPRIFEPFMQQPHAVEFNGVGLGIGLAVVRELVIAHGGSVSVSSAGMGQGSEFEVVLPLNASQASAGS